MRPKSVLTGVVALVVLATGFGGGAARAQAQPTGSARDHGSVSAAAARSTPADSPKTPRKPPMLPVTPLPPAQRLTAKQRVASDAPIERRPRGAYVPVPGKVPFDAHGILEHPDLLANPVTAQQTAAGAKRPAGDGVVPAAASVPGAPTAVAGAVRDGAAAVSWTAPASDGGSAITGYTVTASPGGATATATAPATTAEVFGLTDGTAYTFTVTATNGVGTGPASAASSAVTPQPATYPAAVTNLQVTPGNAVATASWRLPTSDGGADLMGTVILINDITHNKYLGYVTAAPGQTSATVQQLADGTTFTFSVYAWNRSNYGGPAVTSNQFTPVAGPLPAPPASVAATPGTGQVTVAWTASTDNGGSAITGYVVTAYDASGNVVGSPARVVASALSYKVTGLTNGSNYFFGVAAVNASGTGPNWYSLWATPAAAPTAPGAVIAYPSNKSAFVTWTPPNSDGGSPIVSYTVTATSSSGTSTQTVSSPRANFTGLTNGAGYTFTVTAANAVTAGPASSPSAPAAPSDQDQRVTGAPRADPQPPAGVNVKYVQIRDNAVFSGNGRYIFYHGLTYIENLNNQVTGIGDAGWYRYDTVTALTDTLWTDPNLATTDGGWTYPIAVSSYDGSVFAGRGSGGSGYEIYVWRADTAKVTLASANAAGAPTAGTVAYPVMSADGRYVAFVVHDSWDMASHDTYTSCNQSTNGHPDTQDLYRFDTQSNTLTRIPLEVSAPNITVTCVMPAFDESMGISANGQRILIYTEYFYNTSTSNGLQSNTPELIDVGANGSPSTSLIELLKQGSDSGWVSGVGLSDDGHTAVGVIQTLQSDGSEAFTFARFSPDTPTAAPVAFANAAPLPLVWATSDWSLSRSGKEVRVGLRISTPSPDRDLNPQNGVIDVATGRLAVTSQVNGSLQDQQADVYAAYADLAIDGTGRKAVLTTTSPNMLGASGCSPDLYNNAPCVPNIVVVDLAAGTVGVLPNQAMGCNCGSSLRQSAALQNYAGDPVNTATGSYTESVDDGSVPDGGLGFDLRRTYNSAAAGTGGRLGPGWSDPYAASLSVGTGSITVNAEDGARAIFTKQSNGSYTGAAGTDSTLAAVGSTYTLTLPNAQVDTFDTTGRLLSMKDRNGRGLTFAYSGSQQTSTTDSGGRTVTFSYNSSGRLTKATLPDGHALTYGYDSSGRLTTFTDPAGHTTSYGYDGANRLTTVTDPNGNVQVANTYDASGRVTAQTQAGGPQTQIAWDPSAETATVTEAGGRITRDYYADNVLISHVDADGGVTSYQYDSRLDLTAVTDPDGNTATMTYDPTGNMLTRTAPYPLSYTESWTYDSHHNVLTYTDGRGGVRTNTYDSSGKLVSGTDPDGAKTTYTYTSAGLVATVTDPDGRTTTSTYDAAGDLASKKDPAGGTTTFTYDAAGRLLTMVDPRGNATGANPAQFTTTYGYDAAGRATKTTDPDGHVTTDAYDAAGHLTSVTDPAGKQTTYTYDAFGHQLTKTDPSGHTTTAAYDPQGDLISLTDATGDKSAYAYDAAGRLISQTSPRGKVSGANAAAYTTTYTYDANGNQTSATDPLGNVTTRGFDALGRATSITDARGGTSIHAYDANGNVVTSVDPAGRTVTSAYDKEDRLLTSTDPVGKTTKYTYDLAGQLLSETSPLGETTSWTYDGNGLKLSATDPRGNATGATKAAYTTTYIYDPAGHLLSATDPLGHTTKYTYDKAGLTASSTDGAGNTAKYAYDADSRETGVTDPRGDTTTFAFDPAGNLLSVTDALGGKTSYGYDAADRKTSAVSPRGNAPAANPATYTTTYGYDADGDPTTITDPTGAITTTAYDANGRAVSVTDPLGHTTATTYDAVGNIVSVKDPTGAVTSDTYNADNQLASATDALGGTTAFTRDAAGRLLSRTSPLGAISSWSYDADGRIAGFTDPRGNANGAIKAAYTTTYGFDAAGNQTTATDPQGHTTTSAFDADNNRTAVTDPLGLKTTYAYDGANRLASVTDPAGDVTSYGHDGAGNTVSRTDANGHSTAYAYDAANRLTTTADPLGHAVTYGYDADGNRISVLNARGQSITTAYDPRGLTTGATYSDGTAPTSYTYDAAGRMITAVDADGTHTLGYNAAGRLTSMSQPAGGSFAYGYDAAGHITSRTYPDAATVTYSYNAGGQQTSQTAFGATTSYGYDPAGNLTTITEPSSTSATETFGYDGVGRLTTVATTTQGAALAGWQITRDAAGRPTAVAATRGGATATTTYIYDNAGRLTSACPATGANNLCTSPTGGSVPGVTYGYDKVGNRLTQSVSSAGAAAQTTSYSYDSADELTSSTAPGGAVTTYRYDADGNQTSATPPAGAAVTRTYDAANRISSESSASGLTVSYGYDAFGDRATQTQGTNKVTLAWDTNNALPQLASTASASASTDYAYDPRERAAATQTAGKTAYLLDDWQGNVTDTVDATGKPLAAPTGYDAFGNTPADLSALGDGSTGFDGQLLNPDNTTYDLRARQYDPTTGRFLSRDPITQPAVLPYVSAYVYSDDDPTQLRDPSGQSSQGAPGDGYWAPGSGYQHDFALEMAYEQEVVLHGPDNVYADFPGGKLVTGGTQFKFPSSWAAGAEPDLIAAGVPTPRGTGFAIWDVKPASRYGRSYAASVDKLEGYITGFEKVSGWPAVKGDPIAPEARPYPPDALGAEGIMLIFNGPQWKQFGIPDPTPNHRYPQSDIAPPGDTKGLIYYRLDRFGRNQGQDARAKAIATLAREGAQVIQQAVCHPIGAPTGRQRNPLQYVGTATGADVSAYTRATTLTAFPPGPLEALMPDPYPLPTSHLSLHVDPNATLPPAPSNSGNGGSSGGWGGLGWLAGGTGLAIGGQVVLGLVAPEAEAPVLVAEGAPLLTRAMVALAA